MSFLNPVSEPVLRFKSTDAGAPQINYNSRAAGDVKAVLKACLVTGYGATASAGWSIVNEVGHVAEFVSPSAAMSDYRLGIDDTSTSSTTWYYQYQNARVNPSYNAPVKAFTNIDKAHASNGWQLIVTDRGIIFLELVYSTQVSKLSARITYFCQVKSGLVDTIGANIMFFNTGHNSAITEPRYLYYPAYPHMRLGSQDSPQLVSSNAWSTKSSEYQTGVSSIDVASALYITNVTSDVSVMVGEVVGILSQVVNNTTDMYGANDVNISDRPALSVCAGISYASNASKMYSYGRTFLVYLDYWEY